MHADALRDLGVGFDKSIAGAFSEGAGHNSCLGPMPPPTDRGTERHTRRPEPPRRPIGFRTWSPCSPRDSLRRVPVPRRRSDLDRCNRPDRHHPDLSSPCGRPGRRHPRTPHLTASWMAMQALQLDNRPDHCPRPAGIVAPFSNEWSPALSIVQCASNRREWIADCAPGPTRALAAQLSGRFCADRLRDNGFRVTTALAGVPANSPKRCW